MYIKNIAHEFYQDSKLIRGHSPTTIKRYKYVIDHYCRFASVSLITDVTEENIRALFLNGRAERNWKINTLLVFHKSLSSFFSWCVEREYLQSNPVKNIEAPRKERTIPPRLTQQDALRLLDVIHNYPYDYRFQRYRNLALFSVALFAGLRKSEILQLRYADVDIENRSIFVRAGKGSKDRIVPMSATLVDTLLRYRTERKALHKTCPEFFTSTRLNHAFTENGLKHLVETIRKVSPVPFTMHMLRHTFATLMLEGGCDIYSLSKMMGHAEITTTAIYLAASAQHLRNQMTKHPLNGLVRVGE